MGDHRAARSCGSLVLTIDHGDQVVEARHELRRGGHPTTPAWAVGLSACGRNVGGPVRNRSKRAIRQGCPDAPQALVPLGVRSTWSGLLRPLLPCG